MARPLWKLAAVCALCLPGVACRNLAAYGPGSDERLEAAVSDRPSEDGRDIAELRCNDVQQQLREVKLSDRSETDRLQLMLNLFTEARQRFTHFDEAVARNPDLLYGNQGEAIKSNMEECRDAYAGARSDLDRYVREVAELPVLQEVQGSKTVSVARLDFDVARAAITALEPDDRESLNAKIDAAEKKVGPKPAKAGAKGAGGSAKPVPALAKPPAKR